MIKFGRRSISGLEPEDLVNLLRLHFGGNHPSAAEHWREIPSQTWFDCRSASGGIGNLDHSRDAGSQC